MGHIHLSRFFVMLTWVLLALDMAYSIYGPISCRQEIELDVLGLLVIKPRCSVYLAACPAYAGRNLSLWEKLLGEIWLFRTFFY